MNIGIIGVGGVGGYFGGKLTQLLYDTKDLSIYFVARNQHLREIQNNGLILDTDEGVMICKPTYATDNISELPNLDICLICVKSYDLDNVLIKLKEKISLDTLILPLLNGVDINERIRHIVHNGVVFPSCVYVGTHIERYGKVTQRGGACTIIFGEDPQNDYFDTEIFNLFKKSNIKYEWLSNPYIQIWNKYIFVASFGLVTANFNKTIGEVLASVELRNYVQSIINEIINIAKKNSIVLSPGIIKETFAKAQSFPYETKTSFQRDFENTEKPDERDIFGGIIIQLGNEFGIPVITTKEIYDSIQKKKKLIISS